MQLRDNQSHFRVPMADQSYQSGCFLSTTMTCQKPKTSSDTLSCDERLTLAMKSYQNDPKQSVWGLAKHFKVAPSTFQDRLGGATSCTDEMSSRCHLSPTETQVPADYAVEIQKLHFPLTPQDIRLEAQHIWYSKDPATEAHGDTLGVNWYNQVFLKDNPEMASKMGKGLDWNRTTCTSHAQLAAWYQDVHFDTIYKWYPSSSTRSS